MNKRGTSTDAIVILVVLLVVGLTLMISIPMFNAIKTQLDTTLGSEGQEQLAKMEDSMATTDTFFMILWFGFAMGALISAFFVRSHPVFLGISLIFFLPMIMLGPIFTQVFDSFANTTTGTEAALTLTKTNALMSNLYIFNFVFAVLLLIVLYVSFRSGDA